MRYGSQPARSRSALALLLTLAFPTLAAPARAGVTLALQPATQTVVPGAEFDLFLAVTQSGSAFNAFDAIVGHDPAALTLLQLSPLSLQEGSLMTNACANRFHQFRRGADRDTITDVLLCNGVSVSGPGQIYRLHFRAATAPQTTAVQLLPGARFYDAGIAVTPVSTTDATVVIGNAVGVGPDLPGPAPCRLRASPNPSRSLTWIVVETGAPGLQELTVRDLLGRVVRRLGSGWFDPGRRELAWDGRDDSGEPRPPGIYYVQLRAPSGSIRTPIVRIR